MATRYEYQVVTAIPENDEWAEQELVQGASSLEDALARAEAPIEHHYPQGTRRYIEVCSHTDWEPL
jgi:hypothetical protein